MLGQASDNRVFVVTQDMKTEVYQVRNSKFYYLESRPGIWFAAKVGELVKAAPPAGSNQFVFSGHGSRYPVRSRSVAGGKVSYRFNDSAAGSWVSFSGGPADSEIIAAYDDHGTMTGITMDGKLCTNVGGTLKYRRLPVKGEVSSVYFADSGGKMLVASRGHLTELDSSLKVIREVSVDEIYGFKVAGYNQTARSFHYLNDSQELFDMAGNTLSPKISEDRSDSYFQMRWVIFPDGEHALMRGAFGIMRLVRYRKRAL